MMSIQFLQNKNNYAIFSVVFLLLSLVGAISLVKTSQNIQKRATVSDSCSESFCNGLITEPTCWPHNASGCIWLSNKCTCNRSQPGVTITGNCDSFVVRGNSATLSVARCKEEYYPDKTKSQCETDQNKGVGCPTTTETFAPGTHSISNNVTCGIFQVDAYGAGWECAKVGCRWDDSSCQAVTPTSTPTSIPTDIPAPTNTPTPTPPTISCSSLTLNGQSNDLTVTVNTPVNLEATISNFGIISSAKVNAVGKRLGEGTQIQRLAQGINPSATFNPTEPGIYVFEVNAYESSSCNYLCSVGSMLYQNTVGSNRCVTNSADWVDTKTKCTSTGCTHWLTIVPENTPIPTNTPVPPASPTPSLPPANISCLFCLAYNQNWQQITNLNNLKIGENVYFAVVGSGEIVKGRFKVTIDDNTGNWQESNQKNTNDEFYFPYLVQQAGTYQVNCEVYSPSSGWR